MFPFMIVGRSSLFELIKVSLAVLDINLGNGLIPQSKLSNVLNKLGFCFQYSLSVSNGKVAIDTERIQYFDQFIISLDNTVLPAVE